MNINQIRYFGPDGVCSNEDISVYYPPIPPHCSTGIDNVCVNPLNNHIVVYYVDGRVQDTGIVANCGTNCFQTCIPSSSSCITNAISCTPKKLNSYLNGVQFTNQKELIFTYNDGSTCSLGEICKCQTVIFSQNQIPTCGCPTANCGDVFINLATGNVYIFFGQAWDIIGNLHGDNATGPTGPTGAIQNYNGTGLFGPGFPTEDITYNNAINLLRQPNTFYPVFFGTGIGTDVDRFPDSSAIVLGNHNDNTGPNNAENSIAIGYYAGQISQGTGSIAIGAHAGYQEQHNSSIAIGVRAGYQNQNDSSIAIGYESGNANQNTGAISIGYNAGNANQGIDSIAIGTYAGMTNQASNSIIINASGITLDNTDSNTCVIKPIRNDVNPNYLYYNAITGEITYDTPISSIKYKTNVKDLNQKYVDAIYNLRPVEFDFTNECYGGKHSIGLIAEEVEEHVPELVFYDELDKSVNGLDYEKLVAPLIKIVQEYKMRIDSLEKSKEELETIVQNCKTRIEKLESLYN